MSTDDLVLYIGNKRYSSWSLRGYLVMVASGAPFKTEIIWLDQPETHARIRAINPAGFVPVLKHGELLVNDTLAITEYMHELRPEAGLWPADRVTRARARSVVAEMHSGFTALRKAAPMDLLGKKPYDWHGDARLDVAARADVARVQNVWKELRAAKSAAGGPFLFGTFSAADAFYAPVVTRFTTYGYDISDPVVRAYMDAIQALPAFQSWLADAKSEMELPNHV